MPDEFDLQAERHALVRALRQQLESLRRAGLEWVPCAEGRQAGSGGAFPARGRRIGAPAPKSAAPVLPAAEKPAEPGASGLTAPPEAAFPGAQGPAARSAARSGPNAEAPSGGAALASHPIADLPIPPAAAPVHSVVTLPLAASGSLFGASDFESPPVPEGDRPAILATLATEIAGCVKCAELAATRTQTVFGVGNPSARLMFIGEAPGGEEDRQGEPFVGRAGQLLTDMITKGMGLSRDQVYIANILKCRPPDNRTPSYEECSNCVGYLEQQIAIIRPEFICMLGLVAAQTLLETTQSLGRLRSRWHSYRGIRTIVTYHPAYLLRSPAFKKQAWEDLQMLMKAMGLPLPKTRGRLEE